MKRTIIEFLIGLPIVICGYFLLDFLYCTFFTHEPFIFNIRNCGIAVLVWFVVELVTYLSRRNKSN